MNGTGFLVFRILLGLLLIGRYVSHPHYGDSGVFTLLIGVLFVGFGIYGFYNRSRRMPMRFRR
jgi:hypothetical protein